MPPLLNRTIAITRAAEQAEAFAEILSRLGANPVSIPVIEIQPLDSQDLRTALIRANGYDWIIFTSVNGAEIFLQRLKSNLAPARLKARICAIGPGTADKIRQMGYPVHLIPKFFQAEGILKEFAGFLGASEPGPKILLPRAREARELLPETLAQMGAEVDVVPVYNTIFPAGRINELRANLRNSNPDMITFTSSSTVINFMKLSGEGIDLNAYRYASIGPITSTTALEAGISITVTAMVSTLESLAEAISDYFTGIDSNPAAP